MKKIIFLILSVLTISNVGFSEIQEAYGMIFDERVFGDNKACKASGAYILGSASFQVLALAVANDKDFNSKEKIKYMEKSSNEFSELQYEVAKEVMNEGEWKKYPEYEEHTNIVNYYKNNCRKISISDFHFQENSNYPILIPEVFFELMRKIGMLKE